MECFMQLFGKETQEMKWISSIFQINNNFGMIESG